MKAVIYLDVPEYQIGQPVSVYFKDSMYVKGICKEDYSENNVIGTTVTYEEDPVTGKAIYKTIFHGQEIVFEAPSEAVVNEMVEKIKQINNERDDRALFTIDAENLKDYNECLKNTIRKLRKDNFTWCEIGYRLHEMTGDAMYDIELEEENKNA